MRVQAAIFNQSEMLQLFLETGGKQLMEIVYVLHPSTTIIVVPILETGQLAWLTVSQQR